MVLVWLSGSYKNKDMKLIKKLDKKRKSRYSKSYVEHGIKQLEKYINRETKK